MPQIRHLHLIKSDRPIDAQIHMILFMKPVEISSNFGNLKGEMKDTILLPEREREASLTLW
jgi:hypothetical protein